MTEEEKDILILKILERPQSLTDDEVTLVLSDRELLDIYNTSLKVKDALRPALKVDPNKEWELMKARIEASQKEDNRAIPTHAQPPQSSDVRIRKSFIASFLHNISKRPVAAAVGGFILAGALAVGLLWNPTPVQREGNTDRIAQNTTNSNNNNPVKVTYDNQSNQSNGYDLTIGQENLTENQVPSKNDGTLNPTQNQSSSTKANQVQSSNATNTKVAPVNQTQQVATNPVNQTEEVTTPIINNPNSQDLAYVEEEMRGFESDQLTGQFPEEWDIDECLKLQQARIDNELALRLAESRKKEYEIFRENILLEYEISNPDADEATLKELRAYLDEVYGNLYSAIP